MTTGLSSEIEVPSDPRGVVRIYLAGSVPKGTADRRPVTEYWSAQDESLIVDQVRLAHAVTVNPNRSDVDRRDFLANFGCDLALVESCEVIFVDGRGKRGLGVGAEMMFAATRGIYVIALCPRDTPYRRPLEDMFGQSMAEWIHPFVYGLADHIAGSVYEAANWVNGWLARGRPVKPPDDMRRAINYWKQVSERNG